MTTIELQDSEPSFKVERRDDETGYIVLTIHADGTTIKLNVGRFADDAEMLHDELSSVVDTLKSEIIDGWEDRPDREADAFIDEGDRGWYVTMEGVQVKTGLYTDDDRHGFVSREIAAYHLAKAMADGGVFPNCWYVNERGNTENCEPAIRKYHDEGGDKMLPLEGVEYETGDEVSWNGDEGYSVEYDYGQYGVVIHERWNRSDRHHVTDRSSLAKVSDDEDDD